MTLLRYFGYRVVVAVPVLLSVVTVIFIVVRVLPGDPAQAALGDYASQEAVQALRSRLGLDAPLLEQYLRFLSDLAHGNLGTSLINGASVSDQVRSNLPYTLELTFAALLIGIGFGVPLGVFSASHHERAADYVLRFVSLASLSTPAFYLGILLLLLFGVQLRWLPTVGGGNAGDPRDLVAFLILPALTLGLIMSASMIRLTRGAMLNILDQDFLRAARAKGLHERVVIFVHALRPALLPIVSLSGVWSVALIGDSVTTEVVFARPGLGKMMVGAMLQRDYTSLQSIMVVFTAFVVGINLLTDLAYGLVDPRISR